MSAATEPNAVRPLPYGPLMSRLLRPLQRGFLVLNRRLHGTAHHGAASGGWWGARWAAGTCSSGPAAAQSGLLREAPLGYVIRDGAVYCVAGYGRSTPWFLNLLADPAVEVDPPDPPVPRPGGAGRGPGRVDERATAPSWTASACSGGRSPGTSGPWTTRRSSRGTARCR